MKKLKTLLVIGLLAAGVVVCKSTCINGGALYAKGIGQAPSACWCVCTNGGVHTFAWDGLEWPICPGDNIWCSWTNTTSVSSVQFHMMTTTFESCPPNTSHTYYCDTYCSKSRLSGIGNNDFFPVTVRYGSCIDPCCGTTQVNPLLTCLVYSGGGGQ